VTHLRKLMLEELDRRNYSQSTVRTYVRTIEDFARYFKRPPDQLGPEQIREYQAYLFRERKLDPNTVNQRTGALRFFFVATLKRGWSIAETPYPRKVFRLPKILSPEQVARLIDAAPTLFYRMLLMALYATGLRRAELAHLKVGDIDSERMVIHVKGGKGRKDRDVMLSPKLLEELRQYWRTLRVDRRPGCFRAIAGIPESGPSTRRSSGKLAGRQRNEQGSAMTFTRTH
jgi:integrase/recombinase XerD